MSTTKQAKYQNPQFAEDLFLNEGNQATKYNILLENVNKFFFDTPFQGILILLYNVYICILPAIYDVH